MRAGDSESRSAAPAIQGGGQADQRLTATDLIVSNQPRSKTAHGLGFHRLERVLISLEERQLPRYRRVLGTLIADMSLQPSAPEVLLAAELTATSAAKRTFFDSFSNPVASTRIPPTLPIWASGDGILNFPPSSGLGLDQRSFGKPVATKSRISSRTRR